MIYTRQGAMVFFGPFSRSRNPAAPPRRFKEARRPPFKSHDEALIFGPSGRFKTLPAFS